MVRNKRIPGIRDAFMLKHGHDPPVHLPRHASNILPIFNRTVHPTQLAEHLALDFFAFRLAHSRLERIAAYSEQPHAGVWVWCPEERG